MQLRSRRKDILRDEYAELAN